MTDLIPYYSAALLALLLLKFSVMVFSREGRYSLKWMLLSPFEISSILTLMLFAGFRYSVGTDYGLYSRIFATLSTSDWGGSIDNSPQELGYTVFSLIVKAGGAGPEQMLLCMSILTVGIAYLALRIESSAPVYSLALYILFANYLAPMNTVRQGLAVALCFLASILYSRARVAAFSLFAVAFLFHSSVAIVIILFFVVRWLRIGVVAVIALFALAGLGGAIIAAFPLILNLLAGLNQRYEGYAASTAVAGYGTIMLACLHALIAILLLCTSSLDGERRWFLSIYAMTGPLALLGTTIPIATRLSEYTAIFLVVVAPAAFGSGRTGRLWKWATLVTGFGYFALYLLNYGGLIPYSSWI